MSRELKFRAWNGEDMVSPDYITREGIAYWKENSIPCATEQVMQYIGLKDKKGVDIYEGDILKTTYAFNIGSVYFSTPSFGLETKAGVCIEFDWQDYERMEIIGNIHQNPELL